MRDRVGLRTWAALAPVALLVLVGCGDLDGFRGTFSGQVVGQSEEESFIRRGFGPETTLTLVFDPATAASSPGTLTTSTPDGAVPYFERTELRAIEPLAHDLLSDYDFPDGRLRNYIFAARVRDDAPVLSDGEPVAGRDATVFVSLMKGGVVEVRVLVGAAALYGLFRLRKPEEME